MNRLVTTALVSAALALAAVLAGPVAGASAGQLARETPVTNTARPALDSTPRYATEVRADPGTWSPTPESYSYQWLVDGQPVADATSPTYTPRLRDIGHRVSVRVTAAATGFTSGTAVSQPVTVGRALFKRSSIDLDGTPRFGHTLRLGSFGTTPKAGSTRRVWVRDGRALKGQTGLRHAITVSDVGHRVGVRVTARREGYVPLVVTSAQPRIKHRTGVRHTVTYHVETRGPLNASVKTFKQLAQATYDDPRGWRGGGVSFRRVARGGDFTLVLAEASWLPRFSSACSSQWSCRVGRYVVINQTRWQHASPMWNRAGRSLRDYRHMVVNHETGHWLGHGHSSCPRSGAPAPVMQQQSKGLQGCRPNPFPTTAEWRSAWRR